MTPSDPRAVIVSSTAAQFEQSVTAGPHHLVVDEPTGVGGADAGPTPYDLLLAALGACTSMTLTVYARRKQWPLERVSVELTHARIHAKDCIDCEDSTLRLQRIERHVTLTGPLTVEQRARLLELADKCPVHKTLTGMLDIRTKLVDSP
ncbi:MAG: OsmC-like protein [Myxococcales bacterium]|nr:OsmC-like protein [Myxococcales bacterium]